MSQRPSQYVTCRCQHCDKGIEFDSSGFEKSETRVVECPHCHSETVISIPRPVFAMRREDLLGILGLDREATPSCLLDFVGQERIKSRVQQQIVTAKQGSLPLGHIILVGPAGSGKTTLALLMAANIAEATDATVKTFDGTGFRKASDLAGILTNLEENDLLLIGNIDLMPKVFSEYLEPALADFKLDIIIDEGPNARSVRLNLPHFTLIATATDKKLLTPMLQACFTTDEEMEGYNTTEITGITRDITKCFTLEIDQDATDIIVRSTNGTPGSVLNRIRHVRVYAKVKKSTKIITAEIVTEALKLIPAAEQKPETNGGRQGIPSEVRREVWRRDGGKCVKCGSRKNLEYDHIIPVAEGGSNTTRNIELLCEVCNRAKSDLIQ